MGKLRVEATGISGLYLIHRSFSSDNRGAFARLYCRRELEVFGVRSPISQINYSINRKRGALRGLHYQVAPHAEDKLITCTRGEVFDVAVDIRKDSPTFLKWYGVVLGSGCNTSLLVPKGFAHGFQTLMDDSELLYMHTAEHSSEDERVIFAQDPAISILWPLEISEISERDRLAVRINGNFQGLNL
jgi:dTDP-4-dehydrorhamnose 3,5-epimerase